MRTAHRQADACVSDKGRLSRRGELRLNGHTVVQTKLLRFERLLAWLATFDPARLDSLQKVGA